MSFGYVIGALIEEGLTALSLSRKASSSTGPHTAGLVRLRRFLLRLAVGAMILAILFWGVAEISGWPIALAGYWSFGIALAAVFGWAVSFSLYRP